MGEACSGKGRGTEALAPGDPDFSQGGSEPHSLFPMGVSEVLSLPIALVWRTFPPLHTHPCGWACPTHIPVPLTLTTPTRIQPSSNPTLTYTCTQHTHAPTLTHIRTVYVQYSTPRSYTSLITPPFTPTHSHPHKYTHPATHTLTPHTSTLPQ